MFELTAGLLAHGLGACRDAAHYAELAELCLAGFERRMLLRVARGPPRSRIRPNAVRLLDSAADPLVLCIPGTGVVTAIASVVNLDGSADLGPAEGGGGRGKHHVPK